MHITDTCDELCPSSAHSALPVAGVAEGLGMCQPAFHSAASVSSSGMPIGTTGSWLPSLGTLIDDVPWDITAKQVAPTGCCRL